MNPEPAQKPVSKALIPAAGRGTRMAPISNLLPKELIPLGATPAIRFIVEEALAAGILDIGVVVRKEKPLLQEYLNGLLAEPGFEGVSFTFVEQAEPRGLGEAIAAARDFLADHSYALLLPDNFLPNPEYRLADLVTLHHHTGLDVVGILELGHEHSGKFGNCGMIEWRQLDAGDARIADEKLADEVAQRSLRIEQWADKGVGTIAIAPGEIIRRTCGRYICTPLLNQTLDLVRPLITGELSEVPAYQRLVEDPGVAGFVLPGPVFDLGIPQGYLAASAWLHHSST
jgi:UTP--glucose-1-phosphate uridylyltransferase